MDGFRKLPVIRNSRKEWERRAKESSGISREIADKYDELEKAHNRLKNRLLGIWAGSFLGMVRASKIKELIES